MHDAMYRSTTAVTRCSVRVRVPQDVRPLEPVGQHQCLVVQQFARRAVRDDAAVVDHDRARAGLDDELEVMRRDQLR